MRYIAGFAMLCLLPFVASASTLLNPPSHELAGKVKSIRLEKAPFTMGREGKKLLQSETTYDVQGRLLEERQYNDKGELTMRTVHTYGEDGLVATTTVFLADGAVKSAAKYSYARDERGWVKEARQMDADGNVQAQTAVLRDEDGRVISDTIIDKDGNVLTARTYGYDFEGRLARQRTESRGGQMVQDMEIAYGPKGRKAGQTTITYLGEKVLSVETLTCDDDGRILNESRGPFEGPGETTTYLYSPQGVLMEALHLNKQERPVWKKVYTCDRLGNWTREISSRQQRGLFQPYQILYRTISYY